MKNSFHMLKALLKDARSIDGVIFYSYEMFFDSETESDDLFQAYGDIRVVSDPMSAQLLEGATLDFKDGLMGSGFAIDNPNAQRTCGCGSSFS